MARPKKVQHIPEPTPVPEEQKPSQTENIISIILGLAVVLVIGAMIINAIRGRQNPTNNPAQSDTTQEATSSGTHIVTTGETLWSIAEKYYNDGYKWVDIQKANNLSSGDAVEVGDSLVIPTLSPAPSPAEETPTTQSPEVSPTEMPMVSITTSPQPETGSTGPTGGTGETGQTLSISSETTEYTVQKGDTLWAIAQARYNNPYRWVDIARANNLQNPDLIYVDAKLNLPQ